MYPATPDGADCPVRRKTPANATPTTRTVTRSAATQRMALPRRGGTTGDAGGGVTPSIASDRGGVHETDGNIADGGSLRRPTPDSTRVAAGSGSSPRGVQATVGASGDAGSGGGIGCCWSR